MLMLILTRRPHESIRVGTRVRITVLGFKGSQVRLGIEAPTDVSVDREEIWERKQQEVEALADSSSVPTLHEKSSVP
jgi:carbon storage regulator